LYFQIVSIIMCHNYLLVICVFVKLVAFFLRNKDT